ncbi:MAG: ATP-binding cassette domain-containing protein [Phycisphaerales bacterium]|nr:ATP-binding cassette domain-containing protein [Phycisphaerales bacterium]MCB9862453.1 ATP-binding cassette domain-containing protein [Phycisphaerales bacterium]
MIKVKNLTKAFGERIAVNSISFQIEEGEIVGFLGPNGAGKTTTIRILTCYMPATSGAASVAGFDVFSDSMAVRRVIGYLPESTPLDVHMRTREYLTFRGKIRGLDRSERTAAIKRVADLCWLGEFINRPIHQLSKGMRQRVGLADALLHDPKVLVLDEPTVGLDPTQIRETRNLIQELAQRHTVLLSSHILPEVEATCKRTIIIAGGNIVAAGSPDELKARIREGSRLIAELTGDAKELKQAVGQVSGVTHVECATDNGWNRLTIETKKNADPREDIFKLAKEKKWSMRELRLEASTLEEFFVRITAEQAAKAKQREAKS